MLSDAVVDKDVLVNSAQLVQTADVCSDAMVDKGVLVNSAQLVQTADA